MRSPLHLLAVLAPLGLLPAACVPYASDAGGVDPNVAVRSDVAQVCAVRPVPPSPAPLATYLLRDDGRLVGSTRGPSFLCWEARPGPHHLTSDAQQPPGVAAVDVTLVAGQRVFLRQTRAALDVVSEMEARAELADIRFADLASPPAQPLAVAGGEDPRAPASPAGAPPPLAPPRPPRRPDGIAYGAAAGIGPGLWRASTAATPSPGFAALGSIWVGLAGFDALVVGLRIDVGLVGSGGTGDIALHLAGFPAAGGSGPIRDLMLFADAGVGGPLSLTSGLSFGTGGVAGIGRVGAAWERWRVRSAALGPFLAAEAERGAGIMQTAALGGLWLSLYSARQ